MMHKAALGDVQWTVPASMINESIRTHANNLAICEGQSPADAEFFFARSCYGSERRRDLEVRYFARFLHRDEAIPRVLWLPDGEMVERLLPHVRQFARVHKALADAGALGSSLGDLLVNGRFGVILLDRGARMVAANDRARDLLLQFGGLSDRGGFLNASRIAENDVLQRLLARALPPLGIQASIGSMTIGRPNAQTRLVVRLATMVAVGRTVRDIAEMTGRTEATVRRHLKEIFRKQGISRQADLARLVLSLDGFPRSRRYWKHKLP